VAAWAATLLFASLHAPIARALPAPGVELGARAAPPRSLRAERLLDRERLRAWGIERPARLAFDDTGALYVLDTRARRVVRLAIGPHASGDDPGAGNGVATLFGDESGATTLPSDIALDLRGSLLVLDRGGATLLAYDRRSAFLGARDLDPSLAVEARAPESRLLRDPYGDLWLLAPRERDLVPLDARLERRRAGRFLAPEDSLADPVAAAFLPNGGGWIADRGVGRIWRFDTTGRIAGSVALDDSATGSPSDLVSDATGALFVAYAGASRIVVFAADGSRLHTRWLGGDGPTHAWRPGSIAWGGGDRVAVADESRDEIWIFAVEREAAP
jgi:sugar lactone lactonase YvrE